jgi:catechol 2,3-dioxygenase-like lactoylglutathione lyase family enzyme
MTAYRAMPFSAAFVSLLVLGCQSGDQPSEDGAAAEATAARGESSMTSPPPILATNVFYYYDDVEAAWAFYTETLGLRTVVDYGFAKILRVAETSYLTLVNAADGMHSTDEPRTATLAFVTEQVEGWYDYLSAQGVTMRSELRPAEERPHDGFVAVDPEGYLLEFERFNPHAENERLMPALAEVEVLYPAPGVETNRPAELGLQATVLWLYYRDLVRMERFYEETFGSSIIVDQGWAKVFPVSTAGYLGLVDGERGLHQATDEKSVTVSFFTADVEGWFDYMHGVEGLEFRTEELSEESGRVSTFVGYDPEGYFLEWDTFLNVDGNEMLLELLEGR